MGLKFNNKFQIIFEHGTTRIIGRGFDVEYREKFWLFRVNPSIILPGLRKEHTKIIYNEGRRVGVGYKCSSNIPLALYKNRRTGVFPALGNFIRCRLGLCCLIDRSGYIKVVCDGTPYIVVSSVTQDSNLFCKVYSSDTEDLVFTIIFNASFSLAVLKYSDDRYYDSVLVAGYIADAMLTSISKSSLQRSIEIST